MESRRGCSSARRHGRSTEEEVREILRNALKDEGAQRKPLGSRLRERFARIGPTNELPELPGETVQPAKWQDAEAALHARSDHRGLASVKESSSRMASTG
jgi:hypothetical protein